MESVLQSFGFETGTEDGFRMHVVLCLVAFGLVLVEGVPLNNGQRIVGGEVTSIEQYPFAVLTLESWNLVIFNQHCGASVLNNRAFLSAAHCFSDQEPALRWRARVGSTRANSGGIVHHLSQIFNHPNYVSATDGADIAILRSATPIVFNERVQPMVIPAPGYNLPDNASVIAIGWGNTSPGGVLSEQLRHVEVWHVKQSVCRERYAELGFYVSNDMLCSGWLDVGGRDQCQGDSGGPLVHNGNVVVGVCSWGWSCALAQYPGVNARVSAFTQWILEHA